jgi:anti-sigma factor ChrR (cupin superfamily)
MLNMDFDKRVLIESRELVWQNSPKPGVLRKPLAREEAERGHATSIVQYEPGAQFHAHNHPLGEEILVLEGTFSDETGDYHAGCYFRNPEGFRHAPFSVEGALILVKLHQFQDGDEAHVVIQTDTASWLTDSRGVDVLQLHSFNREHVELQRWPAGTSTTRPAACGGEELYVVSGELEDAMGEYPVGTWLRNPAAQGGQEGSESIPSTAAEETVLWIKTGHL